MNVEKCAVPNCNNPSTTGVPFPRQTELQEKWLQSLEITDFVPTPSSFVCLNHFGDKNLLQHVTACRLCMCSNEMGVNVFDKFEEDIVIATAITHCIPLIKITKQDCLPKLICTKCYKMVKLFHKFRDTCLKMDVKQRELLPVKAQQKRKLQEDSVETAKKACPNPQNQLIQELPARTNIQSKKSDIDKKFDKVEAELMKALEGKLTEEMRGADNIIIEIQSDDETEDLGQELCPTNAINQKNVVKIGPDQLQLPKGIKVSVNQAKVGVCDAKIIRGINNSEYYLVDNYLFEHRLCKGPVRQLRCLVTRCRATAEQTMVEPGKFEDKVLVKVAHNHQPPTEEDRRRQMFLHSMRRKMQSDRMLNFRSVYEEFCEKDPEIKKLVPLKTVINQICCQQMSIKSPGIHTFEQLYEFIENDDFQKLHFTYTNKQFYQERFMGSDGSKAVVFANCETIEQVSDSKIMYVDASFKIDTKENFSYHLVSILVWVSDSVSLVEKVTAMLLISFCIQQYYPIMFALINEKSEEIYKLIFNYLRDTLAPRLRPDEIVTDYEATIYYSLGETYLDSHIGGSVFYYTQNLYKKICSLNLSRELETNSCFRNIYHMILMLPLLPVNTILDGLNNIELQASEMGLAGLTSPIFEYVRSQWMTKVTPDLFCVHRLENRINENVIAPFKKLRDFLMLSKGKLHKQQITVVSVVEKLIELEGFLQVIYSAPSKKSFARDLSSSQKKNVIRAWQYIETHPKININNFFSKVLGYIKCMENQLWIWGFYRYMGDANDELINAANFSIVNSNEDEETDHTYDQSSDYIDYVYPGDEVVMDVVIDQKDGFLVKEAQVQRQVEVQRNEEFQDNYIT
ncbi:uncharacterized protein BDFB_000543 [Asbolus verrucosus]|uniref:Uncharacterized protein n=1 Tax=Asbolus verrucosus TaxID=1661398 RepID=A0A482VY91_ASBVE|nr:uncharacterized protein BDFB_000543 [Asbolus verrucosus]